MRKILLLLALAGVGAPAMAEEPSAGAQALPTVDDLLARIDANMTFETRTAKMKMTVVNPRRTREFEMQTYGRGEEDSAIEYLSPAREAGTRMLKKGDELWLYMPAVERTQKISGHMMRQGMMGSDVSYEDMMTARDLRTAYAGKITGIEKIEGRDHYVLELLAKDDTVAYPKRVQWIDVEHLIPSKQELYALSGMLLKTWEMSDVQPVGERKFPMRMRIIDKLQEGTYTEIVTSDLKFGVDLEDEVFSMRWLERG